MTSAARDTREVPHEEQSVVSGHRGVPWWAAVLLAFVLAAVGAGIDLGRSDDLGTLYRVLYVVGCVVAVGVVARRGLFAAMVQPPLVLVVAVPVMAEVVGRAGRGGLRSTAVALALPLVNAFPTTAITTVVVLVLGGLRLVLQRSSHAGPAGNKGNRDDRPDAAPYGSAGATAVISSSSRNGSLRPATRPPLPGTGGRAGGRSATRRPESRPRPLPDDAREPRRYGPSSGAASKGRTGDRPTPPLPVNPRLPPVGRSQPGLQAETWRPLSGRDEVWGPDSHRPDSHRPDSHRPD